MTFPKRETIGLVYLMSRSDGACKIGFTADSITNRWYQVRREARPLDVAIVSYFAGTLDDEAATHARFRAHHIRGEWFLDVPEIREFFAPRNAEYEAERQQREREFVDLMWDGFRQHVPA